METFLNGKKTVYVPNEFMIDIERSYYEYEGLRTLVTQFTSDSPFKPDAERLKELTQEYLRAYVEYNLIFNQIVRLYLKPEDQLKTISANFQISALIIE